MAPPIPPPVKACLFDMDGLLIDSEDLYTICTNEVLKKYGRPNLPWSVKAQLQGRPGPQAAEIFHSWAQLPVAIQDFYAELAELQKKHFPKTKPLPGVPELLSTLQKQKVHIALATSSHEVNYKLKTTHLTELFSVFPDQHKILGDDIRIPAGRGKPAPDIYLLALETINAILRGKGETEIQPEECLVFEDSVPGVESGRRAGMQVVWCPHPGLLEEYRGREKEVLAGLTGEHKEAEVEAEAAAGTKDGAPGEIDDGYGTLLKSLEDFPYQQFGIGVEQKD